MNWMRQITVILMLAVTLIFCGAQSRAGRLKGKIAKRVSLKFRPEAIIVLPDNTGFIQSDLPYEIVHWDFKTMKELGRASGRQAATASLIYDPRGKVYRVSYQGIEIYDAVKGDFESDLRPFRSTALGGSIDTQTGNLIVWGTRSVFFIDPMSRQLIAETPIAVGSRIVGASVDVGGRTLYVTVQPGVDNRALAVPVDLDRFTVEEPIELGTAKQFSPLVSIPRPGQAQFYLSGVTSEKDSKRLYFKAVSAEQGEFAQFFLVGSKQPPNLIFSPDGRYLLVLNKSPLAIEGVKNEKGPSAGSLILFEVEETPEVITVTNEITQPRSAAFSADGTKLYVIDSEGSIFIIE
jgi:DNA-binding beta-propeller fold protein YncE